MDPDENLETQLRLARRIVAQWEQSQLVDSDTAGRLAELVLALDEWLRTRDGGKAGFLPGRWA